MASFPSIPNSESISTKKGNPSQLSSRANPFLSLNPNLSYIKHQIDAMRNQYHPLINPSGAIPLSVAENKLQCDVLLTKINSFTNYTTDILTYTTPSGLPLCKEAMARFISKYLFQGAEVSVENIVICAGCCSMLHQLSLLLCEPGDSVLVPTPYYPAFDPDFMNIGRVSTIEVNPIFNNNNNDMDDIIPFGLDVDSLEQTYQMATENNKTIKALLLTNPNNPMGIVYSQEEILIAVAWSRSKGIHIIMDEIYALSTFSTVSENSDQETSAFTSIVTLMNNELGDDIHVIWSLSKDFGGSGLRCGMIYSHNKQLIRAMGTQNDAFMVSNLMQECAARLLSDDLFLEQYISSNRILLRTSYLLLTKALQELQIPFIKSRNASTSSSTAVGGGIFVFANFRRFLQDKNSFTNEYELGEEFARRGIVLTPGKSCHCQVPGYFRICYAWVPLESLKETIRRITEYAYEFDALHNR